jgi:uncharacterized OB-fold protein
MSELRRGVFPAPFTTPPVDATTRPYWQAALEGRLVQTRCTGCGTFVHPPQPVCFSCQGTAFEWQELPGTGRIYSYTVVRHPLHPRLAEVVPYVSAVIELDGTQGAGARVLANVTDCDPEQVRIGDRVRVWFDRVSESLALPRFEPDPRARKR